MATVKNHVKTPARKTAAQVAKTQANIARHARLAIVRANQAKLVKRAQASPVLFSAFLAGRKATPGLAALFFARYPLNERTDLTTFARIDGGRLDLPAQWTTTFARVASWTVRPTDDDKPEEDD